MTTTTSMTMMKAGRSTSWRRKKSSPHPGAVAVAPAVPVAPRVEVVERAWVEEEAPGPAAAWAAAGHPDLAAGPVAVGACLARAVAAVPAVAGALEPRAVARPLEAR
jgi:hypothetical protein